MPERLPNSVLEDCDSTNTLAKELGLNGHPHGTWISSRRQTSGRGRQGREWKSLDGNLFFSMILRPTSRENITWIPIVGALATIRAIKEVAPHTTLKIKWPNDLFGTAPDSTSAKVGGILGEAHGTQSGSFLVLGLGLNVLSYPVGLDQPTSSLCELEIQVSADDLRPIIVKHWMAAFQKLESVDWILKEYSEFALYPRGTSIEWMQGRGKVLGLGRFGELEVELPSGDVKKLFAEDVKILRGASSESLP